MKALQFLLILISIGCITNTASAQCTWTIVNEIDCDLTIEVECLGAITFGLDVCPGTWATPWTHTAPAPCFPLGPGCILLINGQPYPAAYPDDIICCDSSALPEDCVANNCAYISVDPTTSTISFTAAKQGPGWNCP